MVVYNKYLDKTNRSHKILHADMTYENDMMTFTLIVPTHLIERHEQKIVPKAGISITNFKVLPECVYESGDCDHVISILESSVVDILSLTCKEYNFIPDTTIKQFASNTNMYSINIIGVVVTLARKVGSQYSLHIKGGNTEVDKATICFSIVNCFLFIC
jgi:hypothetical protein